MAILPAELTVSELLAYTYLTILTHEDLTSLLRHETRNIESRHLLIPAILEHGQDERALRVKEFHSCHLGSSSPS